MKKGASLLPNDEADAAAGASGERGNTATTLTTREGADKGKPKQKRKKGEPNPLNLWPQMPKIQSPTARANAYLRVAGLSKTSSSSGKSASTSSMTLLDPKLDLNSPELKFGRMLAGTEERKRHEAVKKLQKYMKARCDIRNEKGGFSELDLLKLWKGLWYTLFLADKVPVQDELSKLLTELIWCVAGTEEEDEYAGQAYMDLYGDDNDDNEEEHIHSDECNHAEDEEGDDDSDVDMEEIANTMYQGFDDDSDDSGEDDDESGDIDEEIEMEEEDDALIEHCRGAHLAALFVKTFFQTVRREWGKMDKHRVDKFYTLVRLMMQQVFKYMAVRHWNIGIIRLFNDTLFEEVLSQTPNGLRYHLIDLALEELVKVNATAPMPLTEATFMDVLEPYFAMAQTTDDKLVHARVMDKIFRSFLEDYSVVSDACLLNDDDDEQGEEESKTKVFDQVHVGSVAQFIFEIASDNATFGLYRKQLYEMHKVFAKRLKKAGGKDVDVDGETGEEEGDYDDEDEMVDGFVPAEPETYDADAEHTEEDHDPDHTTTEEELTEEEQLSPPKSKSSSSKKKKQAKEKEHIEEETKNRTSTTKSKEKKKRKHEKKLEVNGKVEAEEESATTKSDKKGKKKRKTSSADSSDSAPLTPVPKANTGADGSEALQNPVKSEKKKKKKKKKEGSKDAKGEMEDEVITISTSEQKKARSTTASTADDSATMKSLLPKKHQKLGKKNSTPDAADSKDNKRVSFGKVNYSKSHKASMKALKTADPPRTAEKTPEKSILLKRTANSTGAIKKKKKTTKLKKRAIDYF